MSTLDSLTGAKLLEMLRTEFRNGRRDADAATLSLIPSPWRVAPATDEASSLAVAVGASLSALIAAARPAPVPASELDLAKIRKDAQHAIDAADDMMEGDDGETRCWQTYAAALAERGRTTIALLDLLAARPAPSGMTTERLLEAVTALEAAMWGREVRDEEQLKHIVDMFPRLRVLIAEGRREKAMRWLGFIQGYLWTEGVCSLEELKRMNMPRETMYDAERDGES